MCSPPLHFTCTLVSTEVIDEVEALRQRDVEKAAYQPEPLTGWKSYCLSPTCICSARMANRAGYVTGRPVTQPGRDPAIPICNRTNPDVQPIRIS